MSLPWQDRGWSWSIMAVAAGLLIYAIFDLGRTGGPGSIDLGHEPGSRPGLSGTRIDDVELYRILPDPTSDLGRRVLVAGTVVGIASTQGFWVRDLRDNVIYIGYEKTTTDALTPTHQTGTPVRVRGRTTLLSRDEQDERLHAAALVLPAGTNLLREVIVTAGPDDIEIVR